MLRVNQLIGFGARRPVGFVAAMAKEAADQTALNFTTEAAVTWDTDVYDSADLHNTGSDTSRMTVPAGASYVRLSAGFGLVVNSTTRMYAYFKKNGAVFVGSGITSQYTSSLVQHITIVSAPLAVTAGDYFEAFLLSSDSSIDVEDYSWFAMEKVG
jgi:hypothetical protein